MWKSMYAHECVCQTERRYARERDRQRENERDRKTKDRRCLRGKVKESKERRKGHTKAIAKSEREKKRDTKKERDRKRRERLNNRGR